MQRLLAFFILLSLPVLSFAQEEAASEDGAYLEDTFEDTANADFVPETAEALSEAPAEEPAPLEAPYGNAEDLELSRAQARERKKRRKRKKRPLPSVFETDNLAGPNVKGGRVRRRYIQHPMARKGLYKITKEGDYLYQVQKTPQRASISVRFGIFDAPNLVNSSNGIGYSDLYGGDDPILWFTYEWKLDDWMRNLSFNIGSGLLIATGNGRLESGNKAGEASLEEFTLLMAPNHAGFSYKFRFNDEQTVIPFVEGGLGYFVFNEYRDDGDPPLGRFGGAIVAYAVGGVAWAITDVDRDASIRLDADYGINGVWLTAEYRQHLGFGTFDFTSGILNAGVMVHF